MQMPCASEDHGMEDIKEASWRRRKRWTRGDKEAEDSPGALESLLPLLQRQIWGKAGSNGAEGICGGQSMGSLEHLYFKIILFLYLFLPVLGLSCYRSFSLVVASGDYSLVAVSGLLTVGGFSCCRVQALGVWASVVSAAELQRTGSVFVMHRLGCSSARGIFLDQGSIPCFLHWQADSLPLHHQGSTI